MAEQIFISYRKDGGEEGAEIICDKLKKRGYTVFYDNDSLKDGYFDERLFRAIDGCDDFIIFLSKNSLDRCVNEDDWVRKEIAHAKKNDKNIVPVRHPNFKDPDNLPPDIKDVLRIQAVEWTMKYLPSVIDAIVERITAKPMTDSDAKTEDAEDLSDTELLGEEVSLQRVYRSLDDDSCVFEPCEGLTPREAYIIQKDRIVGVSPHLLRPKVVIPSDIKEIDEGAFENCTEIEEVELSKVRLIGERAFKNCTNLRSVKFSQYFGGESRIGRSAFEGCVSLLEVDLRDRFVKCISERTFAGCEKLAAVHLGQAVGEISSCAFWGCGELRDFCIPRSLKCIGNAAFENTSIRNVEFFEHLEKIGSFAFAHNNELASVRFLSIVSLGEMAFGNCSNLTSVTFTKGGVGNEYQDVTAFAGCENLKGEVKNAFLRKEAEIKRKEEEIKRKKTAIKIKCKNIAIVMTFVIWVLAIAVSALYCVDIEKYSFVNPWMAILYAIMAVDACLIKKERLLLKLLLFAAAVACIIFGGYLAVMWHLIIAAVYLIGCLINIACTNFCGRILVVLGGGVAVIVYLATILTWTLWISIPIVLVMFFVSLDFASRR